MVDSCPWRRGVHISHIYDAISVCPNALVVRTSTHQQGMRMGDPYRGIHNVHIKVSDAVLKQMRFAS